MKKILSLLLIVATLLTSISLFSCNDSQAPTNDQGYKVALDLTDEWNNKSSDTQLVQGCIVVRKAFAEAYPESVKEFLDEYESSIRFTNSNPTEAANFIKEFGIFANNNVAAKAIPNCNIAYMDGQEMKASMAAFLEAMYSVQPASIGGALPGDDFYYSKSTETGKADNVRVYTLNGTTGFGMAKLMNDNKATEKYTFSVESDPTKIIAGLANGSIDIAALPTNAASNVYNKTNGKVQVMAINTLGVLYLLDKTSQINSISDLEGKTIYCPAQNPTFILKYILKANNINATIDSTTYATAEALKVAVSAGQVDIAVLPEPMVSIVMATAN